MRLLVHELDASGLFQELTAPSNLFLEAVRPHIYRHNQPTGSLKVQVLDGSDTVLAESETINISDIGSNDFYHGYVRFMINAGLVKGQTYKFKIVGADGYSFDESAYIGICNDYDLRKYEASYSPNAALQSPLDMEVWVRSAR